MGYYVVRQGDHLDQIASRHGLDPQDVWDDPANARLRALRGTGNVLNPGDVLFVPPAAPPEASTVAPGTHTAITRYVPKTRVRLQLRDAERRPIAGEPFRVEGAGQVLYEGASDGEGVFEFEVRVTLRHASLELLGRGELFPLALGGLDPATETAGAQTRLRQLGLYHGVIDGERGAATEAAIVAFQKSHALDPTGELDESTVGALRAAAGC